MRTAEAMRPATAPAPASTPRSQFRVFMDTAVSIELWSDGDEAGARAAISRAFNWFRLVESTCNRFDASSEIARLSATRDAPVAVSPLLLRLIEFALAVAEASDGAFDPTVGDAMVRAGFRRSYRDGVEVTPRAEAPAVSYRDVVLDRAAGTVTLRAPLTLDLNAVAKGCALDLASEELRAFPAHAIAAGGDVIVRGVPPGVEAWPVQVRDPRQPDAACRVLHVRDAAVCTSGGYLRRRPDDEGHHLLDAATGASPDALLSATVVAPSAMLADALATAAFVLGPERALPLLTRSGVDALLIDAQSRILETPGVATMCG